MNEYQQLIGEAIEHGLVRIADGRNKRNHLEYIRRRRSQNVSRGLNTDGTPKKNKRRNIGNTADGRRYHTEYMRVWRSERANVK